jgi:uncharacterized protein with PIN domain
MIELEDPGHLHGQADIGPVCPYCETAVKKLYFSEIKAILGKRYLYYCSNCLKVLGISHRKGFWMG